MSPAAKGPGPRSIEGLAWLARVGVSPAEPLRLVMGWSQSATWSHVKRLEGAGYLRRIPMTRGDGSLLVVTGDGAAFAAASSGAESLGGVRTVAPTSWAHAVGTAWVAAWLELRPGIVWRSERELRDDPTWSQKVTYETSGGPRSAIHRPDLAVWAKDVPPFAVEVELQRKSSHRLRAILAMYQRRTRPTLLPEPAQPPTQPRGVSPASAAGAGEGDGELRAVLYVVADDSIAKPLRRVGADLKLGDKLTITTLSKVIEQTEQAAANRKAANVPTTTGAAA